MADKITNRHRLKIPKISQTNDVCNLLIFIKLHFSYGKKVAFLSEFRHLYKNLYA